MNRPVIAAIGHVAFQTSDVSAAVEAAQSITGLRATARSDASADLTEGAPHHSLQYIAGPSTALHHIGLVAVDEEALKEIRSRADSRGLRVVVDKPLDRVLDDGFVLEAPEGFLFEIYRHMPIDEPTTYDTVGERPLRFGHVTITVDDPAYMSDFLQEVLDFRVSDELAGGFFLRCNADHHGIGVFPDGPGFHHYAWETANLDALGRVADRVDATGGGVLYGPSRHGAGNNLAVYFHDAARVVVEYYAEMDRIYDDDAHVPTSWDMEQFKWFSRWAPWLPDGWVELAVPRLTADTLGLAPPRSDVH